MSEALAGLSQDEIRKKKREDWAQKGMEPYPTAKNFQPAQRAVDLHREFGAITREEFEKLKAAGESPSVSVSGRVLLHRSFGKSTFLTIQDRSGRIQIFAQASALPAETYEMIKHMDLGDIVFAKGHLFKTKTGELTVDAVDFRLQTKSILPLPEKFHGLQDVEVRYRQRYLDLMTSEASREVFRTRSRIVQFIRNFFLQRDYLEVETPMLHPLVSGAAARPFQTFHNTLKMELFLRIAPELYLKRLVVGGFDRVFEMNRCFRNEGISIKHNPEFTMLEFYEAYATYEDLMELTEQLMESLALEIKGSTEIEYQGQKISLQRPFARFTVHQALEKFSGLPIGDADALKAALRKNGFELKGHETLADLQWHCFEEFVEEKLIQPTFITDYPIAVSPLARRNKEKPDFAERFELFVCAREIANGFNELNDPEDQESRFQDQLKRKEAGDEEATDYDADYIEALRYGLPPTAGEGIGIDRLTMLLTDSASIRDVILFPQMRPLAKEGE